MFPEPKHPTRLMTGDIIEWVEEIAWLLREWKAMNARLFDGRLQEPAIGPEIIPDLRQNGRTYHTLSGDSTRITFPPRVLYAIGHRGDDVRNLLLHEMIHQANQEDSGAFAPGHGDVFIEEANRVAALLGLPPCTEEDADTWPL
jgi:hypothetical protein